jgi:Tfp pilus assembly protein PilV
MSFPFGTITKKRRLGGFSFLEIIISIFVLSVGFLGIIQLATATLRSSFFQRDAVIASMLVQEGIELVYNIRDTNVAKGNDAFDALGGGSYKIDYMNPSLSNCTSFSDCQLSLVASSGFYKHDGGTPTKFSRKIIVDSSDPDKREITSVVSWDGATLPSSVNETTCSVSKKCAFSQAEFQRN